MQVAAARKFNTEYCARFNLPPSSSLDKFLEEMESVVEGQIDRLDGAIQDLIQIVRVSVPSIAGRYSTGFLTNLDVTGVQSSFHQGSSAVNNHVEKYQEIDLDNGGATFLNRSWPFANCYLVLLSPAHICVGKCSLIRKQISSRLNRFARVYLA